ncbi:hypothetical protein F383_33483 [Gossypium arboreum]|uniref:Uncharacterized protein n=1 Tax=Gossypium arboreum TaxID=29729 RepID=A0A0B0N1S0_GOSAR|nr:hypothetical protein F383_33483 [Gossypium arboreum]
MSGTWHWHQYETLCKTIAGLSALICMIPFKTIYGTWHWHRYVIPCKTISSIWHLHPTIGILLC